MKHISPPIAAKAVIALAGVAAASIAFSVGSRPTGATADPLPAFDPPAPSRAPAASSARFTGAITDDAASARPTDLFTSAITPNASPASPALPSVRSHPAVSSPAISALVAPVTPRRDIPAARTTISDEPAFGAGFLAEDLFPAPVNRAITNYRGEEVQTAPIRYFEDFEGGKAGREWPLRASISEMHEFGNFLGPMRAGEQVLNIRLEPGNTYMVVFDIYFIAYPQNDEDAGGSLEVIIDGAPMAVHPFAELRAMNRAANGSRDDFNEAIYRDFTVPFIAGGPIVEIRFRADEDAASSAGSWGIDNVLVDEMPIPLASFGDGGFENVLSGGGGGGAAPSAPGAAPRQYGSNAPIQPNSPEQRTPRTPQRPRPPIIDPDPGTDSFPDDPFPPQPPETPTPPPPPNDPPDYNPPPRTPPNPEVPAPGSALLLVAAGGALAARRRRA